MQKTAGILLRAGKRATLKRNEVTKMEWNDLPQPVRFALNRLEEAGYEAALVGGCVRDRIMGRAPGDYDITTSAAPEETLEVFRDQRTVPTGLKHGTVTVVYGGMGMEITSFRQDGTYTDMRRPDSVRFTRSLREDVLRRDFTMNALAWEQGRGVIDHTGGLEDIRKKGIRAVGEPERRFTEDALRILRAVRFSAQMGFAIEEKTRSAVFRLQDNVGRIAVERVRVEMEKTLLGAWAARALAEYRDVLRPRILGGERLGDEGWAAAAQRIADLPQGAQPVLAWAALLLEMGPEGAEQALRALRADNATTHGAARRIALAWQGPETLYALRRAVGEDGFDAVQDAICLRSFSAPQKREDALLRLGQIRAQQMPCAVADLAVGGRDLIALGVQGRAVGAALQALLEEVLQGHLPNEREALLRVAKEL